MGYPGTANPGERATRRWQRTPAHYQSRRNEWDPVDASYRSILVRSARSVSFPSDLPSAQGKGTKIMAMADRFGLPIAIHLESASPQEVTLVEATVASRFVADKPRRLIGDRAYDSDPLDEQLRTQGIELIAPHRRNRVRPKTQDGRRLRREIQATLENRTAQRLVAELPSCSGAL